MFEQVGVPNHETYYRTIHRLLKPGGLYLHHSIALRSPEFERLSRRKAIGAVAMGRYIFPVVRSTTSACRWPIWSVTASRCTTWRRCANTMRGPPVSGTTGCPRPDRRGTRGRQRQDEAMARLPGRRLDRVRARQRQHFPDAGLQARAGTVRPAADPRRSVSIVSAPAARGQRRAAAS